MPIKIAINGFGRIGRAVFRQILKNQPKLKVAAINDLSDAKTLAHLLKYDSLYGVYEKPVKAGADFLEAAGKTIKVLNESDPRKLPWKKMGIDIVLECTGRFRELKEAKKHLLAGARQVIISAPCKGGGANSFVLGVNEQEFDSKRDKVCDIASCTTNCAAPIAKVLDDNFKIARGFMTTIHAYTNDQRLLDLPHKDLRRARAAAINLIPTTTGAAKATIKVLPQLKGKLDGIALRVPVPTVSILDFVCQVEKAATIQEVNYAFKKASNQKELKGILGVEDAELVSTDYIGNPFSAVVDSSFTAVNKDLVKIVAWYDNEWAYAGRLSEFAAYIAGRIR